MNKKFIKRICPFLFMAVIFSLIHFPAVHSPDFYKTHYSNSSVLRTTRSANISPLNFFSSSFIAEDKRLSLENKSQKEIEKEIITEYLGLPIGTKDKKRAVERGIVDNSYISGMYKIGKLKEQYSKRYEQLLNDWILGGLIEEELKGYALYYYKNLFSPTKSYIVSEIETKINSISNNQAMVREFNNLNSDKEKRKFCEKLDLSENDRATFMNMSTEEQQNYISSLGKVKIRNILKGKIDNPISDKKYSLTPKILNNLSFNQLTSYYIRMEIENYLFEEDTGNINPEIVNLVNEKLNGSSRKKVITDIEERRKEIGEIVEKFLNWEPTLLGGKKVEDEITMLEMEEVARRIVKTAILGNPSEDFDFNYVNNKRANRWSYYLMSQIKENFEQKKENVERKLDDLKTKLNRSRKGEKKINSKEIEKRLTEMLGVESYERIREIVSYDDEFTQIVNNISQKDPYSIGIGEIEKLVEEVFQFNQLRELAELTTSSNIVDMSISTIREPFLANPNRFVNKKLSAHDDFAISSFMKFYKDIVRSTEEVKLGYFIDNHGEVIFDLWFIKELLNTNKDLSITMVPKSKYVSNDVSYNSLLEVLNHDAREKQYFYNLHSLYHEENSRFNIVEYGYPAQGIDVRRADTRLIDLFNKLDGAVFKGAANFQSTQGINVNRYNLFMVKSSKIQEATRLDYNEQQLVFAYFPPGEKVGTGLPDLSEKVNTPFTGKFIYTTPNSLWNYAMNHPEYYGLENNGVD